MTTDITELAQREKFEAWWEREYKHLESSKYTDAVPHIKYGFWMAYQAGGAELVEALELKEEQRANWFHMAQKLGNNLDAAEKRIAELEREPAARMVVTPTIWKHYTAAQTAIIYEKAMTDAGIKWRSIDERLTHEELESLYLAMKSHFEVMAESASEAEVIECSQIVRALCELQERRTAMLAVAPQEVK
ncbi:hypothetical protein [Klebsiella michiganensis]|uniref:hypothetical protein n=1 Tax=Klebsiella michiganensis TaxID=1134687 RepID=UPI000A89AE8D|nr:hypothetical protein [Klebsiella michiganensis]MDL4398135.1 hypothetical protein [Klebsiella michiganensis]MDL4529196.1 hypothetical protein [Klebsiella michiganensis]